MQQAGPLLYVLLVWWFSTGAILWLVGLPRSTHPFTMGGATVLLAVALVLGVALNQWQGWQYYRGILHCCDMTAEWYRERFFWLDWPHDS